MNLLGTLMAATGLNNVLHGEVHGETHEFDTWWVEKQSRGHLRNRIGLNKAVAQRLSELNSFVSKAEDTSLVEGDTTMNIAKHQGYWHSWQQQLTKWRLVFMEVLGWALCGPPDWAKYDEITPGNGKQHEGDYGLNQHQSPLNTTMLCKTLPSQANEQLRILEG